MCRTYGEPKPSVPQWRHQVSCVMTTRDVVMKSCGVVMTSRGVVMTSRGVVDEVL